MHASPTCTTARPCTPSPQRHPAPLPTCRWRRRAALLVPGTGPGARRRAARPRLRLDRQLPAAHEGRRADRLGGGRRLVLVLLLLLLRVLLVGVGVEALQVACGRGPEAGSKA